jgi:hypothetical protein
VSVLDTFSPPDRWPPHGLEPKHGCGEHEISTLQLADDMERLGQYLHANGYLGGRTPQGQVNALLRDWERIWRRQPRVTHEAERIARAVAEMLLSPDADCEQS